MHGTDDAAALAATHDQVVRRDPTTRPSPSSSRPPTACCTLDSSGLTLEETVDTVLAVVAEHAALDGVELVGKDLLVELADEPVGAGQGA